MEVEGMEAKVRAMVAAMEVLSSAAAPVGLVWLETAHPPMCAAAAAARGDVGSVARAVVKVVVSKVGWVAVADRVTRVAREVEATAGAALGVGVVAVGGRAVWDRKS